MSSAVLITLHSFESRARGPMSEVCLAEKTSAKQDGKEIDVGIKSKVPSKQSPPASPPFLCRCGGGFLDKPGGNPVRWVNGKTVLVSELRSEAI